MIMGEPRGGAPSWASFLEEVVLEVRGRVKDKEKEGKPGDSEVTFVWQGTVVEGTYTLSWVESQE